MKQCKSMYKKAFTFIEVMVTLSIGLLITVFLYTTFVSLSNTQALDKNTLLVATMLNEARSLTLSSKNDSQYGIHFDADKIVEFVGSTYVVGNASNQVVQLNPSVTISGVSLGGGSEVVFERLTGNANQTGVITLGTTAAPTQTKTITIYATGIIQTSQ